MDEVLKCFGLALFAVLLLYSLAPHHSARVYMRVMLSGSHDYVIGGTNLCDGGMCVLTTFLEGGITSL